MINRFLFLLMIFCLFFSTPSPAQEKPRFVYRIGILSSGPVQDSRAQWVQLGYYLKDNVPGADFAIVPMSSKNLEKAVATQDLDFLITNPAQYVYLSETFGIQSVATLERNNGFSDSPFYGGVVFVRAQNFAVRNWEDLKGKRFVTDNEDSLGSWLSVWRELKTRGIQPFRDFRSLKFLGDPEAVIYSVLDGEADAGSVSGGTLERMALEGKIDLNDIFVIRNTETHVMPESTPKILYSTRLYPEWPLARTTRADKNLAKHVASALFRMESDDLAAVSGGFSGWTIPANYGAVLACLREIGFGYYRDYGKLSSKEVFKFYKWRILGFLSAFVFILLFSSYIFYLNRSLVRSKKKLEEEIRAKNLKEADLRRNEAALKNMLMDLAETHGDLQSARDQLLQSEKLAAIGQLAAGVAHELNNPLGFVSSNIALLKEYWDKLEEILLLYGDLSRALESGKSEHIEAVLQKIDKKSAEYELEYLLEDFRNIHKESTEGLERMQRIVKDLKTFAREDRSERSRENVCDIMESILGIIHNEMKYKVVLTKEYAPDLPLLLCNKQQIGQVFINILLNAVQAIEKHGEIAIRIYSDASALKIDIQDTGTGIPEENLKRIFEPFFSTKDVGQGTGLGLSISYDIIRKHGGAISVQSQPGKGSTFTITLPREPGQ